MRESLLQLVATCERPKARRHCPLLDAMDHEDGPRTARG
jgi:hypothetical protein